MGAKFDKLESKLEGEPGVTDAGGLAAAIGRKKYGKENYDKAAAKDKSPKMKKGDEELEVEESEEEIEKGPVKAGKGLFGKPPKARGVGISTGSGSGGGYGIKKSEVELEIDELSKNMEFATMNPIEEIRKAVMELGPEGLRKAMPDMTEDNKILLNDILEDMSKSHTLPIDPPKKLVNVGGENYVEEDVMNDDADEDVFDAAVKEGDNEQKHQGGSHDLTQPVDWKGQMIKSLDEFTMDELATFGEVYKAMKMKKDGKKEDLEKVSASKNLWGKPPSPRGVGIFKGEEDDSVAEKVEEVEGKAKLNDVMDDTPEDKKDDVLRELREKKMKKAKELIKAALKKECPDMMEEKEVDVEVMKKKIKKALIMALNEEYSDEEVEKAYSDMDKGGPGSGRTEGRQGKPRYVSDAASGGKVRPSEGHGVSKLNREVKELKAKSKKQPVTEHGPGSDLVAQYNANMKKAMELFNDENIDEAREEFLKAKKIMADILEMNPGIKKLSQPEPANEAKTTADAVKSPKMAKSIKWYGEENDTFKAGRLGRHSYSSSVNSYYDEMIKKSEEVKEEEELKKSFDSNDLNDLIEADMTGTWLDAQDNMNFKKSEAGMGNFTRTSFSDEDLVKSLNLSDEEVENCLGK